MSTAPFGSEGSAKSAVPYGSWPSPISAAGVAAGSHPVVDGAYLGGDVFFTERVAGPEPRMSIYRASRGPEGFADPVEVLPPTVAVGSRVHEYGGGAMAVAPLGEGGWQLFYVEQAGQRVYRVTSQDDVPVALTPDTGGAVRHGDLTVTGGALWAVTEAHHPRAIERAIARLGNAVLDSPAGHRGTEPATATPVGTGTDFVAWPRVSPDGRRLAWVGWDHPRMPWDGSTLFLADLDGDPAPAGVALAGGPDESVLQPEWAGSGTLLFLSDRSGYWNPYRLRIPGTKAGELEGWQELEFTTPQDMGGPLWTLGRRWFAMIGNGTRIIGEQRYGTSELVWLNRRSGDHVIIDAGLDSFLLQDVREEATGPRLLLLGLGRHRARGLYEFAPASGELTPVRLDDDRLPPSDYLPEPELHTFAAPEERGGREVHAVVYPPRNPEYTGPGGEVPPYIAFVHGGPTAQVVPGVSTHFAYFTSRGIGVVDVNYGGSSGYGREYRERLRGEWGVVDVEDVVTSVQGLVGLGYADPARLAISGGSAGGWTVLSALTRDNTFAAGASYYGVGELEQFVTETHDFESHYIDGLIGPLPEARELYVERAPLNNLSGLSAPVILFQGLLDPVVPPAQAERIREGLERAGLAHAYVTYPREAHGFRSIEALEDSLAKELSFYGRVLGFATPGIEPIRLRRGER